MSSLEERKAWIIEGATQYRDHILDKISYGFDARDAIIEHTPDIVFWEHDDMLVTDAAIKIAKEKNIPFSEVSFTHGTRSYNCKCGVLIINDSYHDCHANCVKGRCNSRVVEEMRSACPLN